MYKVELKVVKNYNNKSKYNYFYWSNVENDFTEETTYISEYCNYKQNEIVNSAIDFIKQNFDVDVVDSANIIVYYKNIEINNINIFLEDLK